MAEKLTTPQRLYRQPVFPVRDAGEAAGGSQCSGRSTLSPSGFVPVAAGKSRCRMAELTLRRRVVRLHHSAHGTCTSSSVRMRPRHPR